MRTRSRSPRLLHRDDRILLIPGTSSPAHLEENLSSIEVKLDDAELTALQDLARTAS
jgi:pyridoxine 4-dehydrogenase